MSYSNIFILLVLTFFISSNSYIVIPFQNLEDDSKEFSDVNELLEKMTYYNLYSEFYLGNSPHILPVFYNSQTTYFSVKNNKVYDIKSKDESYVPSLSDSFSLGEANKTLNIDGENYIFAKETFNLITNEGEISLIYSDKNKGYIDAVKYNKYPNTYFLYSDSKSDLIGYFGLANDNSENNVYNLIKQLKNNNIIKSAVWSVDFPDFENDDSATSGNLVIGELPHVYLSKYYKQSQYNVYKMSSPKKDDTNKNNTLPSYGWEIKIDSFYLLQDAESDSKTGAVISIDTVKIEFGLNIMYAPKELFKRLSELYFEKLFDDGKCSYKKVKDDKNKIQVIYCYKDSFGKKDKKGFPSLNFYVKDLDQTFQITYDDVFAEIGDKIYFLIAFNSKEMENTVVLGQKFLSKYRMTFNYDTNEIGCYKINSSSKKTFVRIKRFFSSNLMIILVILIIIVIIFCYCYHFGYLKKRRIDYSSVNKNISHLTGENMEQGYELKTDN